MAQPRYGTALRHIHALFNVGTMGGLTDGQLLERFTVCDREAAELAFAALVERHGPIVLRVCQSVLRERHDAEDAFQATFLVLVRKAASIRKHHSVVSWLLDLDLLTEEVHQLREQVEVTLRDKLRAERTNSPDPKNAQSAFELARASYLAKARELRTAQRRPGNVIEPHDPRQQHSAAAIGSIDMDAVWKRFEKAEVSSKEYSAALSARKNELTRILSEAHEEAQMLSKLVPGSADYKKHENRVTELKARHEAGREQSERAFALRQAHTTATLYNEIQESVANLAKAKGLTYVVKVSPRPRADSEPNDVSTAVNRSAVYADPRNDLTEEVIRDLNRRY